MRARATVVGLLLLLGVAGCSAGSSSAAGDAPTGPASASASTTSTARPSATASATDEGPQPIPATARPRVTSLTIGSIGVKTSGLEKLALMKDAELEAPKNPDRAGWYADGVVPGQVGPAVIAGHVDSKTGPAVFFELGELKKGAKIAVGLSNGETARFVVDNVVHTRKNSFPTDEVYGPTPDAQLRLITCSGPYDRSSSQGYLDNTIVFATATP